MTFRGKFSAVLLIGVIAATPAHALFNFNEGKDLIFVSATYSIGFDSNVFTREVSKKSMTQSLSASIDYTRQAGLIGVTANLSASSGSFASIRGQDFTDPSLSLAFRKRYGRTTGALNLGASRDSQADPDIGERTQAWNYNAGLDARYPINDRYYITNGAKVSVREYANQPAYSNLKTYSDSVAINYAYTSKLDLNGGYTISVSETSKDTTAYDHSLTVGASGSLLPKLSGSIRMGIQRRDSESPVGGREAFNSFTSGTSVKWMFSRKISFTGDLNQDFSVTAVDQSVNRASAGLRATFSLSSKYIGNAGLTYTRSNFLGKLGAGRRDEMFQFEASIGLAITTHIRVSLAYLYMINYSNAEGSDFERQSLSLSLVATY